MPAYRYYTDKILKKDSSVVVDGPEFHHFAHVMRGKVGDKVELVDGRGSLALATVTKKGRQEGEAVINEVKKDDPPANHMIIAQAIPKMNRMEFILEKCTELGMTELWLFPAEKTEKSKVSNSQIKRMHHVLISAMKQCGRLYLPKLVIKPHFSEWKGEVKEKMFFGDVAPLAEPFAEALEKAKVDQGIVFFVGPESGFSDGEVVALKDMGVKGVKLHENILRTDTASMVALSVASSVGLGK